MQQNFFKKKLKNGLTILFEKRQLPVVAVSATCKYGASYENAEIKGISHFIEHLMFKGTKTRSQEQIAREIEKKGGTLNAFTSEEVTSYWNKLPDKHLKSGIEIASDLILNPRFDPAEFEKEKQVIIQEINMYHDNPTFYVPEKIKSLLYEKPFGMSIAGNASIIKNLTRKQVSDLFKSFYSTDSMILTVVGNADFDEICDMAEKIYPVKTRKLVEHIPVFRNAEEVEKRKNLEQAHFIFGFHGSTMRDVKRYDYEVVGAYLFGGMSSRLFQEIREKRGLAYAVRGDLDFGREYGYCSVYVGTVKEKIKEIKEIILKEIKNLKNLDKRDFNECKEQLIGLSNVAREDSTQTLISVMLEEVVESAEEFYKYEDRINNVKLEGVKKLAKIKAFSTFSLIPE